MGRTPQGASELDRALEAIAQAKTVEQLRQAQAVVLPLVCKLSMEETAQLIGCSVGWASKLRGRFLAGDVLGPEHTATRGGRRRQLMSEQQERQMLQPFFDRARNGEVLTANEIKAEIQAQLGRELALSTVYNMLRRHGWRKSVQETS